MNTKKKTAVRAFRDKRRSFKFNEDDWLNYGRAFFKRSSTLTHPNTNPAWVSGDIPAIAACLYTDELDHTDIKSVEDIENLYTYKNTERRNAIWEESTFEREGVRKLLKKILKFRNFDRYKLASK